MKAKHVVLILIALIGFSVFGEDAPGPVAPVPANTFWWEVLHVFFVGFSSVLITAIGLGIHKLFTLLQSKWHLEGLNALETVATTAVTNGVHYAETMAAKNALDPNGKLIATGDQKRDAALQHVKDILGDPFVQAYGIDKLNKLLESVLSQQGLGPVAQDAPKG